MLEPSARNSNLLPVKANGLVRLRSPPCFGSVRQHRRAEAEEVARVADGSVPVVAIAPNTRSSSAPRNTEMIAGGASLAPRRWSWPAVAIHARSRPW